MAEFEKKNELLVTQVAEQKVKAEEFEVKNGIMEEEILSVKKELVVAKEGHQECKVKADMTDKNHKTQHENHEKTIQNHTSKTTDL